MQFLSMGRSSSPPSIYAAAMGKSEGVDSQQRRESCRQPVMGGKI